MRFYAVLFVAATVFSGCRATSSNTSTVRDLPSVLQPNRVLAYKAKAGAELDALFAAAGSPVAIPTGYASGIHIIPPDSPAEVPLVLTVVTKKLWQGKNFDAAYAVMTDEVFGPNLGVGAQLWLEPMAATLARYGWDKIDNKAYIDDRVSLITDYRGYHMADTPSVLTSASKGWIDECRVVESDEPEIWLCRSTYLGKFWGYVILQMTPK